MGNIFDKIREKPISFLSFVLALVIALTLFSKRVDSSLQGVGEITSMMREEVSHEMESGK